MTLIGAALGSAVPALATFAGPYQPLRAGLAIAVTAAALFLTYGGFTLFDFATERAATFPLPPTVPQPVPPLENGGQVDDGQVDDTQVDDGQVDDGQVDGGQVDGGRDLKELASERGGPRLDFAP